MTRGASLLSVVLALLCTFVSGQNAPAPAPVAPPPLSFGPAPAPTPIPAPAPSPEYVFPVCEGVEVLYVLETTEEIFPNASSAEKQPYRFTAKVTLTNQGYSTLESWGVGLTYKHQEVSFLEPYTAIGAHTFEFYTSDIPE